MTGAEAQQDNSPLTLADHLARLEWRCIGPHRGGRVVAVAGDPHQPAVFYFGSTGGGVWKTTDGGQYWENVSDGFFKRASVGAIAVAASDPNVIYVGMGETTIRGNVSHGDGVYKSTDAGRSWTHLGLVATRNIGKVRVHPHNADIVFVAAFGHAHGPNSERGVYRSTDGGASWDLVLARSVDAGANDLSIDPNNPRVVYAAFWEARRGPYSLSSGGPGSGLFRSDDGGGSWIELTAKPGMPRGLKGKIGVVASPAQPGRVWAIVEAEEGGVYRSDDYGATWQRLSDDRNLRQRAWYYSHIYADPQDPHTVWVLNVETWRSIDGGATFQKVPVPHGDNHDLWIDPQNPQRMINGNDGGATVSFNGGLSWSPMYNQPTSEFYHVTTDNRMPYRVYGAQQDNTTMSVPSRSNNEAITTTEWYEIGGGESGYIAVNPENPQIVYAGNYQGYLTRYDHAIGQLRNVMVWPEEYSGSAAADFKYRFQWTFPLFFSPHDANVLYAAANVVFKTTDEGVSWQAISPDLTRADPATLGPSGGPITKDNTGAEVYATVFALVESPLVPGLLWAGSDDGLIHISRDGGQNWQNVTPPAFPAWALVSIIEASPHDPATAYVAATRYKHDDFAPYLFKTSDYGQSWTQITQDIPADDFTRVIREDPARRGLLYAGTETGIYVSVDDGARWQRLGGNLPVVPIHDMVIRANDLVVATHGRSFWILDDLTLLQQLADSDPAATQLVQPRETYRFGKLFGFGWKPVPGHKNYGFVAGLIPAYNFTQTPEGETKTSYLDAGTNPPDGVIVHYLLDAEPAEPLTLAFYDAQGNELRSFQSKPPEQDKSAPEQEKAAVTEPAQKKDDDDQPKAPAKRGLNRFVWNMTCAESTKITSGSGDKDHKVEPPVPPGRYEVRLTVGAQTWTQPITIHKDPRISTTQEDLEAQFALLVQIRDKLGETHAAVNRIRAVRAQAEAWVQNSAATPAAEQIKTAADALLPKLAEVEAELLQVKAQSMQDTLNFPVKLNGKLAALAFAAGMGDYAPTQPMRDLFAELAGQVDAQLKRLASVLDRDVAAFNTAVRESGVAAITVS